MTRASVELDAGTLGAPRSTQLEGSETLPPATGSAIQDAGPEEDPNEELPRTPSDPSAPFVSSSTFPAASLREAGSSTRQTALGRGHATLLAEPSIASNGDRVLVTWNKPTKRDGGADTYPGGGAAFSSDGGKTFTYVDPETQPWGEVNDGFCCDQRVLYSPKHDLWIWALLYWPDAQGNALRIAVAKGNDSFDARRFVFFDVKAPSFAPAGADWKGYWLDYPNLGLSDDNLFLSANVYPPEDELAAAVVVRIPLAEVASGKPPADVLTFHRFSPNPNVRDDGENLTSVFAHGAGSTMYFAQQITDATLRVWSWPDGQTNAQSVDVKHSRYLHGTQSCERTGAPSTADWCERSDERLASGWVGDGTIGFTWNAQQDPVHGFPYPFVMAVRMDEATKAVVDEPVLWSPGYAYQYATLAPNAGGDVGGVVLAGGGNRYQTCATLVLDAGGSSGWDARVVDASDSDPSRPQAGDYLGVVVVAPGSSDWTGACMTLHEGGNDVDVDVHFVSFGPSK